MKIIDIKNARQSTGDNNVVKIVLDKSNISKFPIQTLYCKERGFSKFLLEYNYENIDLQFEKITYKIRNQIYKLVRDHKFTFYLSGFPRCVFESELLSPDMRWKFGDKIFYFDDGKLDSEENKDYYRCTDCGYRKLCSGVSPKYTEKNPFCYGPLASTQDTVELLKEEMDFMMDENLKDFAKMCVKDLKKSKDYDERKIFFRKRVSSGSDEFKEGFFYRFYSTHEMFYEIINFLKNIFHESLLNPMKDELKKSKVFILGFEILSDDQLRKRLYFSTELLTNEEKEKLAKHLEFKLKPNFDLKGIYLEEIAGRLEVLEATYKLEDDSSAKIKELVSDFELDQKRLLLKFLNSRTKKLIGVSYCEKFDSNMLISKKFELLLLENPVKIKDLGILYGFNMKFFDDKEVISLVFEASPFQSEKVILNYTLKLPEPQEEIEEDMEEDQDYRSSRIESETVE